MPQFARCQPLLFATFLLGITLSISACIAPQTKATTQVTSFNLTKQNLQAGGLALITSSTVTGQEEDKQAVAMAFSEILASTRPQLKVVPLAETLGAINGADRTSAYKHMLEDYRITGIFEQKILEKIGQITQTRYIGQLKLGGFRQESKNRFGLLGLRIVDTKTTDIRLFLQIWDSRNGSVAWEGSQELTSARDSLREETVTFKSSVEEASRQLIKNLP